jgi:hypothetical protein
MGANKFCVTLKVTSVFHIIVNVLSLCLLLFIDKCLCHYCMLLCKWNFKQLQSEVRTLHIERYSCQQTCSPLFLLVMFLALLEKKKMLTTSDTGVPCFLLGRTEQSEDGSRSGGCDPACHVRCRTYCEAFYLKSDYEIKFANWKYYFDITLLFVIE